MTHSKRKGAAGERELAAALNDLLGTDCRRGRQYHGLEGKDVVGLPGVHVECKRTETLRLREALAQSVRDAGEGEVPVVCHRSNGQEWIVVCRLADLVRLAQAIVAVEGRL